MWYMPSCSLRIQITFDFERNELARTKHHRCRIVQAYFRLITKKQFWAVLRHECEIDRIYIAR